MVTPLVTVFLQGLNCSTEAVIELLGSDIGGIVVSDRLAAYNHLPIQQLQLCWAHLIRDLTAIAERPGASAEFGAELLGLQQQLFGHWHHYKEGKIDWHALQKVGDRSVRHSRSRCRGWWNWTLSAARVRLGPAQSAPASSS